MISSPNFAINMSAVGMGVGVFRYNFNVILLHTILTSRENE